METINKDGSGYLGSLVRTRKGGHNLFMVLTTHIHARHASTSGARIPIISFLLSL